MPDRTLDSIDDEIAADRVCYLRAIWAGHDGEAQWWELQVDRLFELRALIERGIFTDRPNGATP